MDPPNWRDMASPEALASLSKKETKRQEVINGEGEEIMLHMISIKQLSLKSGSTVDYTRLILSFCVSAPSPSSELFATEHAHVRMLSVLQMVFSKPLEREELLTSTELATIFPSLDEIIEVHRECK